VDKFAPVHYTKGVDFYFKHRGGKPMSTKKPQIGRSGKRDFRQATSPVNPVYIGCDLHGTLIRPNQSVNFTVMTFLLAAHRAGHTVHLFNLNEEAPNPTDTARIAEKIYRALENAGLSPHEQTTILKAGIFMPKAISELNAGGYTLVVDDDRVILHNFDGAHHADPDTQTFTAFCDIFQRNPRQDLDALASQYFVEIGAPEPDEADPGSVVDQLGRVFDSFLGSQDPRIA
jgi:hypothetical protein